MTENEIKLFRRFLKENGIYSAFLRSYDCSFNCKLRKVFINPIRSVSLNEYLSLIGPRCAISAAFNWCGADFDTFDYWYHYYIKWFECHEKSGNKTV